MELVQIYECLCDRTRLRILNLLLKGPLCVCHLQEILQEPQVKLSRHLGYLRDRKVVERHRYQNWNIYALPKRKPEQLETNLKCLQDCSRTDPVFIEDRRKLASISVCCDLKTRLKEVEKMVLSTTAIK